MRGVFREAENSKLGLDKACLVQRKSSFRRAESLRLGHSAKVNLIAEDEPLEPWLRRSSVLSSCVVFFRRIVWTSGFLRWFVQGRRFVTMGPREAPTGRLAMLSYPKGRKAWAVSGSVALSSSPQVLNLDPLDPSS